MYKIITIRDQIRVPPSKFNLELNEAVSNSLIDKLEGLVYKETGVILAIVSVDETGEGNILPGDGALFYPVTFKTLVYEPEMHEIVKGYVIDVTEFGVFVRMGPLDGMIHVSQIMDDYVSYDEKNTAFIGRDSKRSMKLYDTIVARIVSISLGQKQYKIGLTTRQPGLGALEWLEKEKLEILKKITPEVTDSRKAKKKPSPKELTSKE